jgi:hypothetical protein
MIERHTRGGLVAVVHEDHVVEEPNLLEERVRCEHGEYSRCGRNGRKIEI